MNNQTEPMAPALELKDVHRSFFQGRFPIDVLKGADLTLNAGEMVALTGPSGSGKSTLLQIAGLLEPPNKGDVLIEGHKVADKADQTRTLLRRNKVGFVYQFHHLLPDFTAVENLILPQMIAGRAKKDAELKAVWMLEKVGLKKRARHFPSELSGGEQQRVAIARALINDPVLLLADEPTGNLDPDTASEVFDLLLDTAKNAGLAALIATHDYTLAGKMDRSLKIEHGQILDAEF
jgi:lipoprotein-releasing system ATP-binding protein